MITKPNRFPDYCTSIDDDGVGTITDPNSGQKNAQTPEALGEDKAEGLKLQAFIPRGLFNFLSGLTNKWLQYHDQEILSNDADIAQNTANIGTNTADIAQLRTEVDDHEIRITALEDNPEFVTGTCVVDVNFGGPSGTTEQRTLKWSSNGVNTIFTFTDTSSPLAGDGTATTYIPNVSFVSGDQPPILFDTDKAWTTGVSGEMSSKPTAGGSTTLYNYTTRTIKTNTGDNFFLIRHVDTRNFGATANFTGLDTVTIAQYSSFTANII